MHHQRCRSQILSVILRSHFIRAQIITKAEFVGPVIGLCMDKRGIIKNQIYLTSDRVELTFEIPLSEIVFDFYDKLKTISRGYASLDYELIGFRHSEMVKLRHNAKWRESRCTFSYRA